MNQNDIKAGLNFKLFDILKVVYERSSIKGDYKVSVTINHTIRRDGTSPDFQTYFYIVLKSIEQEEKPFDLQLEAIGHFTLEGDLPSGVIDNYLNLSAPSIVYPYLRAFISNFTLQSGINAITLPPVNFAESTKREKLNE